MVKKTKAVAVYSGGLDSLLAVKLLMEQGLEVKALCFTSNFYDAQKAQAGAAAYGIDLDIMDIHDEMLALAKNPPSGYGKNMNPCIDCHALMFRLAGGYMERIGAEVLASGEVLGQRPFSQKKSALFRVSQISGYEVLRPLSARRLPETSYERKGLVDRDRLGDILGRGREGQFALARRFGISEFPTPGGGCLLTDIGFGQRLRTMLSKWPNCQPGDIELLKGGRIYWFDLDDGRSAILLVGRHEADNLRIEGLAQKGDIMVQLKEGDGPTALIRGLASPQKREINLAMDKDHEFLENIPLTENELVAEAARICAHFAKKLRGKEIVFDIKTI